MNAIKILQSVGLKSSDNISSLDNEEAMERLLEFIEEWELPIQVKKMLMKYGLTNEDVARLDFC